MARSGRGQQVKTFKHHEPQPDLGYKEVIGKVYFDAASGEFSIYTPEHIRLVEQALTEARDQDQSGARMHGGRVIALTMDDVLKHYETVRRRYMALMQSEQKTRVIRFTYASNLDWIDGHHEKYRNGLPGKIRGDRDGISFCGSPALHMTYEVLWEAGGKLYREFTRAKFSDEADEPETRLEYVSPGRGMIIPWTPEREAFFARMTGTLETLIMRLDEFSSQLTENVDWAIEQADRALALPPPSEDDPK